MADDTISYNVCIINDGDLASNLGKRGSQSEITMFNYKKGNRAITISYPHRYPERIQSLINSVGISDFVVLVIDKLDRYFGEAVLTLDAMGVTEGYIILKNYIDMGSIKPYISGTVVEKYTLFEGDVNSLREDMFSRIIDVQDEHQPVVMVDQAFTVKGIGTVALGVVMEGVIKKHDAVKLYPSEKNIIVRSIQVHDNDVERAIKGSRVGLALKNVSPEEIEKGDIISAGDIPLVEQIEAEIKVNKYFRAGVSDADMIHVAMGLKIVPARVEGSIKAGESKSIAVKFERQVPYFRKMKTGVFHLDRFPRVVGKINFP